MNTTTVTAFQALCGDCLLVSHQPQPDVATQHVIIDAGYTQTYHRTLSKAVQQIIDKVEHISLFVVTHTDNDHIGGGLPFIKEFSTAIVNKFWMNHAPVEFIIAEKGPIGVAQGITLRELLTTDHKLTNEPIIAGQTHQIGDFNLSVLSPDADQYDRFLSKWEAQEKALQKYKLPVSPGTTDYSLPIDLLIQRPFIPDNSWSNRSSISFLLSVGNFTGLFTGDAHADVVVNSLKELGYSKQKPIRLNLFKVSHHGSKGNTNEELLCLVDCQHYLISTNGANQHQLPHKEALARIVATAYRCRPEERIHLYFTYNDHNLHSLFTHQEVEKYNICCHYPANHENCVSITYNEP